MLNKDTIIRPPGGIFNFDFKEIWNYRELIFVFSWRDIKVRYKQTVLGILWVFIQPIVTTSIFSIFFGKIAKIPTDGIPYPLFVLIGLTIWNFTSQAITNSSQSLIGSESIIKKVYFPRVVIPISTIVTASIDFCISLVLILFAIVYYGKIPNIPFLIFSLPFIIIPLFLTIFGVGLFTSALNLKYRDVRYILPFFTQLGLFITPIIYPISVIYDYRRVFLYVNPLTGVIETARNALTGGTILDINLVIVSCFVSILVAFIGYAYFKNTESFFADIA